MMWEGGTLDDNTYKENRQQKTRNNGGGRAMRGWTRPDGW